MKKILLFFPLFLLATFVFAQAQMTPEQKADETVNKLKTDLSLTDDQVPKVKAITVDRINKVTAAVKKNGPDKQRLGYDKKNIFAEWETKLKEILTQEQYNNYIDSKK